MLNQLRSHQWQKHHRRAIERRFCLDSICLACRRGFATRTHVIDHLLHKAAACRIILHRALHLYPVVEPQLFERLEARDAAFGKCAKGFSPVSAAGAWHWETWLAASAWSD